MEGGLPVSFSKSGLYKKKMDALFSLFNSELSALTVSVSGEMFHLHFSSL